MAATAKATPCKVALQRFEEIKGIKAEEAEKVELWGQCPPIERLDASIATLQKCKHLSLSSNNIDRLSGLGAVQGLEILSIGRNCFKKLDGIEAVAATLKELWVSYNQLDKLAGIEQCSELQTLYASNNKLKDWAEIDRLSKCSKLEDLLLLNNPLYLVHRDAGTVAQYRLQVLKRLPQLKKLDGQIVTGEEKEAAAAMNNNQGTTT